MTTSGPQIPELYLAVRHTKWQDVSRILSIQRENGDVANPNSLRCASRFVDSKGFSILHWACAHGNAVPSNIVPSLLGLFGDAASEACLRQDNSGWTPIHYSTRFSAPLSTVQALLEACPKAASVPNDYGRTALHNACRHKCGESIIIALAKACGEETMALEDHSGATPLHEALASDASDAAVLTLIHAYPSAVGRPHPRDSTTPLHLAAISCRPPEVIREMVESCPGGIGAEDQKGTIPAFYFARRWHGRLLRLLCWRKHAIHTVPKDNGAHSAFPAGMETDDEREDAGELRELCSLSSLFLLGEANDFNCEYNGDALRRLARATVLCPFFPHEWFELFVRMMHSFCGEARFADARDEDGNFLVHNLAASPWREMDDMKQGFYRCEKCRLDQGQQPSNMVFFATNPLPECLSLRASVLCARCVPKENLDKYEAADAGVDRVAKSVELLNALHPESASIPNREGRLALNIALEKFPAIDSGIRTLRESEPRALFTRDSQTHLAPFQMSAVGSNKVMKVAESKLFGSAEQVACVFEMLIEDPSLVADSL